MDIDMDIDDLDVSGDPIQGFLRNKLEQTKNMLENIKSNKNAADKMLEQMHHDNSVSKLNDVEVQNIWKRDFNGKYIFGIEIENKTGGSLTDINLFVEFNPTISVQYQLKIHDKKSKSERIFTNTLQCGGTILLIIEKPDFLKSARYEGEAIISYQSRNSDGQIRLPKLVLDVRDYAGFRAINVLNGNEEDFLTAAGCLSELTLVAKLQSAMQRKLDHYLIIDCMMREADFNGRKYFITDGTTDAVNGCVMKFVEREEMYHLTMFLRNEEHLYQVLHYMLSNIKDLQILPVKYQWQLKNFTAEEPMLFTQDYLRSQKPASSPLNGDVRKFGKGLKEQLNALLDFQLNVIESKHCDEKTDVKESYNSLREHLNENELSVDLLHEKLSTE